MELKGRTFLITGGASGLGAACGERFVQHGANVVLLDVNDKDGPMLAAELGEKGRYVKTDVTSEEQVKAAVQVALDEFGGLQGVVNCAGIAIASKLLSSRGDHDWDAFMKVLTVNVGGTFLVTRIAASAMAQQEPVTDDGERGVVINTASVAAFDGQIGQVAYSASKGAVVGMTLPIARELARYGIRVVTIAPGIFKTPMMAGLPEKAQQSLAEQVPFPSRLGDPREYAQLAQQIIENSMLNGEVIRLDGSIRMTPR